MPNVPNLDCLDDSDLESFAVKFESRASRADCAELVGRRRHYTTIARDLGHYARNMLTARQCRLRGTIDTALDYERIAQSIYDRLPADLRW